MAKAFWAIASLREQITENRHAIALLREQGISLTDKLELALNGNKELVQHVRSRTQSEHEKLEGRVNDLERYLAKTTGFSVRD